MSLTNNKKMYESKISMKKAHIKVSRSNTYKASMKVKARRSSKVN